MNHTDINMSF